MLSKWLDSESDGPGSSESVLTVNTVDMFYETWPT